MRQTGVKSGGQSEERCGLCMWTVPNCLRRDLMRGINLPDSDTEWMAGEGQSVIRIMKANMKIKI